MRKGLTRWKSILSPLSQPVAKNVEMDTHHLIARALFSSHTFLPLCTRPARPDPFPSLVYILVILSVTTLPSQCLYRNFPPLICLTISACAYSPKKTSCYDYANSFLSSL